VLPFASVVSVFLSDLDVNTIIVMEHVFFWGALGSILLFVPYFLYSKHIHLFLAPLKRVPDRANQQATVHLSFDQVVLCSLLYSLKRDLFVAQTAQHYHDRRQWRSCPQSPQCFQTCGVRECKIEQNNIDSAQREAPDPFRQSFSPLQLEAHPS